MTPDDKAELLEILDSLWEYLDDHSDAEYVDGVPKGNKAMHLLQDVEKARQIIEKET